MVLRAVVKFVVYVTTAFCTAMVARHFLQKLRVLARRRVQHHD